jgi:uncharacterized protein (TIGR02246 family)
MAVHAEINAILAAWKAAFDAGDADGLARLYTAEAVFIGGIGGVNHGAAGVRSYFTRNAGPSQVVFRDVQIQAIDERVALVSMIGAIGPKGGDQSRDFRFLQTYRRDDDGWRIAGHHGSHSL